MCNVLIHANIDAFLEVRIILFDQRMLSNTVFYLFQSRDDVCELSLLMLLITFYSIIKHII